MAGGCVRYASRVLSGRARSPLLDQSSCHHSLCAGFLVRQLEDVSNAEGYFTERLPAAAVELESIIDTDRPDRRDVAQAGAGGAPKIMNADRQGVDVGSAAVHENHAAQAIDQREAQLGIQINRPLTTDRVTSRKELSGSI